MREGKGEGRKKNRPFLASYSRGPRRRKEKKGGEGKVEKESFVSGREKEEKGRKRKGGGGKYGLLHQSLHLRRGGREKGKKEKKKGKLKR